GHNTADMYDIAGEAIVGHILPSTWVLEQPNEQNQVFVELYREMFGSDPDLYAAKGYTAMWLAAQAVREAGSSDPDAIREALDSIDEIETALGDGKMTFDDDGEGHQTGVILEINEEGDFVLWQG